ncbi:hypothetical protein GCM10017620_28490 [Brevundimonas intermedia]|uniref:Phasin domain-containing protein n=1 Tax=Brevundimonas intermedia TaxID=74315 RepID=A0ABQ5TCN2_9CAUL|nr:hypothetical protein [Brevundimonas intermedia]GLK49875.1 hypothetical protein GCM10017620_28490 [Brevundimonas intermedia]
MSPQTRRETREDRREHDVCRDESLLLCAGAGLCQASLITIMASADAFAARLAASTLQAAELATLQTRYLAASLAEMQTLRAAAPVVAPAALAAHAVSQVRQDPPSAFYGAPVVT